MFSEMSVGFQRTTQRCIPEDRTSQDYIIFEVLTVVKIHVVEFWVMT
jgi:hypothetical protein